MTDLAHRHAHAGPALPALRPVLRRILRPSVRLVAIGLGIGLWLLFLPPLLGRTATVVERQGCGLAVNYRDPVTGRMQPAGREGRPAMTCRATGG